MPKRRRSVSSRAGAPELDVRPAAATKYASSTPSTAFLAALEAQRARAVTPEPPLAPAPRLRSVPTGYTYDAASNRLFRAQAHGLPAAAALPATTSATLTRRSPRLWRCPTQRACGLLGPSTLPLAVIHSWSTATRCATGPPNASTIASNGGRDVFVATADGNVVMLPRSRATPAVVATGDARSPVTCMDLNCDGTMMAVATLGAAAVHGALRVLRIGALDVQPPPVWREVHGSVWSARWVGADRVALGSSAGVSILSLRDGRLSRAQHAALASDVFALLHTSDGALLAGVRNGAVLLYDARARGGSILWRLPCSVQHVGDMGWPYVALADADVTLRLNDVRVPGRTLHACAGYKSTPRKRHSMSTWTAVAGGAYVAAACAASASAAAATRIWDASGECVSIIAAPQVQHVLWLPGHVPELIMCGDDGALMKAVAGSGLC